jgi:hypothetical protein
MSLELPNWKIENSFSATALALAERVKSEGGTVEFLQNLGETMPMGVSPEQMVFKGNIDLTGVDYHDLPRRLRCEGVVKMDKDLLDEHTKDQKSSLQLGHVVVAGHLSDAEKQEVRYNLSHGRMIAYESVSFEN